MKIVCHNISESEQWKIDHVLSHDADVYVVPEITCPEQAILPDGFEMAWKGITWTYKEQQKWKGLGIIWKKGHGAVAPWYNDEHFYGIPVIVDGVLILGIWPTKRRGINDHKTYPQNAQDILKEYEAHFEEQTTVVIGDFNCYVNQNDYTEEYGDIRQVNELLEKHGLHSVYHKITGEKLGEETKKTYFHDFNPDHPFFLDYAFTNAEVKSFRLFDRDLNMSDHRGMELVI